MIIDIKTKGKERAIFTLLICSSASQTLTNAVINLYAIDTVQGQRNQDSQGNSKSVPFSLHLSVYQF